MVEIGGERQHRALAAIGLAVIGLLAAGVVYLHPSFGQPAAHKVSPPPARTPRAPFFNNFSFADAAHGTVTMVGPYSPAVYLTDDGGRTWNQIAQRPHPIAAATFLDSQRMLAEEIGAGTQLLISEDAGRTWQGLGADPRQSAIPAHWPAFVGTDGWWPVFVGAEGWWLDSAPNATLSFIWHTLDGGRSWSRLDASGLPVGAQLGGLRFIDSQRGVLTGSLPENQSFVLATADGGKSWQTAATFKTPHLGASQFAPQILQHGPRLLLWKFDLPSGLPSSTSTGPLTARIMNAISDDGGATWSAFRPGPAALAGSVTVTYDGNRLLLLDDRRLWVSTDDGATWVAQNLALPRGLTPGFATAVPGAVYVLAARLDIASGHVTQPPLALLRSTDGGVHWSEVPLPAQNQ